MSDETARVGDQRRRWLLRRLATARDAAAGTDGGSGLGEADAAEVALRIEQVRLEKEQRPRPVQVRRVHDPRRLT